MSIGSLNVLSGDALGCVVPFLSPQDVLALCHTNREMRGSFPPVRIQELCAQALGNIDLVPPRAYLRLLRLVATQPDANANHNPYQAPLGRLEYAHWILGLENELDRRVQENYDRTIALINSTTPTSILQFKNQMSAFWHACREVRDYIEFREKAKSGVAMRTLSLLESFVHRYRNPVAPLRVRSVLEISRATPLKIGEFRLENRNYEVFASHVLDDTEGRWKSTCYGKTHIRIREVGGQEAERWPYFCVLIGRDLAEDRYPWMLQESSAATYPVLENKRHLVIGTDLEYVGRTFDEQGSDRLLDQKLTQVMIEMTLQNKALSLRVESVHDDYPVLLAGGFFPLSSRQEERYEEDLAGLAAWRENPSHRLFPPYEDYTSISTAFFPDNLDEPMVAYARGERESWADIIQRSPILNPGAGVLPEYWAKAPHFAEEPVE